jgi:hypothetical protein
LSHDIYLGHHRGGWGVPIRTTGEKAYHSVYSVDLQDVSFLCANTISAGWIGAPIYWAHRCPPPPIGNADQALCANYLNYVSRIFFRVGSAIPIGAGCIGAALVMEYKQDDRVRCDSPIFMLITYFLGFTNRKRKYVEEKVTATLLVNRHRWSESIF